VSWKYWGLLQFKEKIFHSVMIAISPAMLFALERGNLIILCVPLIAMTLASDGILSIFALALLINIKPYLYILSFVYLIAGKYRNFALVSMLSGILFFGIGVIIEEDFLLFFDNIINFGAEGMSFSLLEVIAFPVNLSSFAFVLQNDFGRIVWLAPYQELAVVSLITVKWALLTAVVIYSLKSRAEISKNELLFFAMVCVGNIGVVTGGYVIIFYLPFLPIIVKLRLRCSFLACFIGLLLPWDLLTLVERSIGYQSSYFSGQQVEVNWTLSFGVLMRPLANSILLFLVVSEARQRVFKITPK